MSKYSHFEMCEKVFGSKYKFDKVKGLVPYSRTDMWDKMIEQQNKISDLETKLAESNDNVKLLAETRVAMCDTIKDLETKLAESESELVLARNTSINTNKMEILHLQIENEQLKQQLTEKEEKLKREEENTKMWFSWKEKYYKELQQAKQQLAEKDIDLSLARNEIDTLKHNLNISQNHDNVMCEQYFEKCKEINQDKISFCIERLEKVRTRMIKGYHYGMYNQYIDEFIKTQINELKEKQ